MTIIEGIIDWLQEYPVDFVDFKVNQLDAAEESYGAFKLPNSVVERYIDGTQDVSEYYMVAIRKPTSLDFERISTAQWLEDLETWVVNKNVNRELPEVEGLTFYDVEVSSTYYLSESAEANSVYQLSLKVEYERDATTTTV